jgi:hypothetical protein
MLGRLLAAFLVISLATGLVAQTSTTKDKGDKTDAKEIVGKVVSVDQTKMTVTITVDGKNQTFTVNDDTMIVGPRGGEAKERLKDDRFTKGYEITVTTTKDPKVAAKIKLDYRPRETDTKDAPKDKDKTPPKDKDSTPVKDKDKTPPKDKDKTPPKDKDKTPPKDK